MVICYEPAGNYVVVFNAVWIVLFARIMECWNININHMMVLGASFRGEMACMLQIQMTSEAASDLFQGQCY